MTYDRSLQTDIMIVRYITDRLLHTYDITDRPLHTYDKLIDRPYHN